MMRIKYYTNEERPNLGFKAKLSIATCGGTIHVDSRSLTRHSTLFLGFLSWDKPSGLDLVGDCFLDLTIFFPMNFDFLVSKMGGNGNR